MRRELEALEERTLLTPTFSLATIQDTAIEGAPNGSDDYATFNINSTGDPAEYPMTVSFQIDYAAGDATIYSDYSLTGNVNPDGSGYFTFPGGPGAPSSVLETVMALSDTLPEDVEFVHISLTPGMDYNLGFTTSVTLRIVDNTTRVSVAASDATATEEGANGQPDPGAFTFTRTGGDLTQALTVSFNVTGSADSGMDYQGLNYQVSFPANVTTVNMALTPINDTVIEDDETVIVTLSSGQGYVVDTPASATVTIVEDPSDDFVDATVTTVTVTKLDDDAEEDNSQGGVKDQTIRISRSGSGAALTVYYSLSGSATNGTDYDSLQTGSITIPNGVSSIDLVVHPIWDKLVEGTESVTVTLTTDPYDATRYNVSDTEYETTVNIIDSAYPIVTIHATDPDATEMMPDGNPDSAFLTVLVSRPAQHSSHAVQVPYTVTGAASIYDYYPLIGVISIGSDATSGTIEISPWWDKVQPEESDEDVILELGTGTGGYSLGTATTATAVIHNTEISTISLTIANAAAAEEGPNGGDPVPGVVNLHRVGNLSVPVTVNIGLSGIAINGTDFTFPSVPVTFPADVSDIQLELTPIWDTTIEGDETVIVALSEGLSYLIDPIQISGEITIDDAEQPIISVTASDAAAAEDNGNGGADPGAWTISRTGGTTQPLTISYHLSGDAAEDDYTTDPSLDSGSITIPAGTSSVTIQLNPEWNLDLEPDEIATLTIDDTDNYVLAEGQAAADITIEDAPLPMVSVVAGDPDASEQGGPNYAADTGTYTISRTGNLSEDLSVTFSLTGTAVPSEFTLDPAGTSQITIPAGQAFVTITLTPKQDLDYAEGDEDQKLTLVDGNVYQLGTPANATITIHDAPKPVVTITAEDMGAAEEDPFGDPEPGNFIITRTGSLTLSLTVSYEISGTASNGTDYSSLSGTVVFPAGAGTANIVVLPLQDNLNSEGDETVIATVSDSAYYTADSSATITIADSPVPQVSVSATDAQAAEPIDSASSADTGTFMVTRQGRLNQSLTVQLSLSGTATIQTDYNTNPAGSGDVRTVTFAVGQTSKTITITPVVDSNYQEGTEQADITINPSSNYVVVGGQATVSIADAPDRPMITIAATVPETTERSYSNYNSYSAGVATITRAGYLDQAVSVQISVSGTATSGSDYTLDPSAGGSSITVDFQPWETSKQIQVIPGFTDIVEPDETVILTVNEGSGYKVGDPDVATIIVHDNSPVVTVYAGNEVASENPSWPPPSVFSSDPGDFWFYRTGDLQSDLIVHFTVSGTATYSPYMPGYPNSTDYGYQFSPDYFDPLNQFFNGGGQIHFPMGSSQVALLILPMNDGVVEPVETVKLTLTAGNTYKLGTPSSDTVYIEDAPKPIVRVTASDDSATEPSGNTVSDPGQFTFTRVTASLNQLYQSLTVSFNVTGSADNGIDYNQSLAFPTSITFPAGESSVTVDLLPETDEEFPEGDETVIVTLAGNTTYEVGPVNEATVTIHPKKNDPPTISPAPNENDTPTETKFYVWAKSPMGTVVGKVTSTDPNGNDGDIGIPSHRFSIEGEGQGFTIDSITGTISTLPNELPSGDIRLAIKVTDGGGLSATCDIDITVVGVTDRIFQFTLGTLLEREATDGLAKDAVGILQGNAVFHIVSPPSGGILQAIKDKKGAFSYLPKNEFHGIDIAKYTIADSRIQGESGEVTALFIVPQRPLRNDLVVQTFVTNWPNLVPLFEFMVRVGYDLEYTDIDNSVYEAPAEQVAGYGLNMSERKILIDTYKNGNECTPTVQAEELANAVAMYGAIVWKLKTSEEDWGGVNRDVMKMAKYLPIYPELLSIWRTMAETAKNKYGEWFDGANEICYDYALQMKVPVANMAGKYTYAIVDNPCVTQPTTHFGVYIFLMSNPSQQVILNVGSGLNPLLHTEWDDDFPVSINVPGEWSGTLLKFFIAYSGNTDLLFGP